MPVNIVIDGPLQPYRLEVLHAFIAQDGEGREGIFGIPDPFTGGPRPAVFSDTAKIPLYADIIKHIAAKAGKKVVLRTYRVVEETPV